LPSAKRPQINTNSHSIEYYLFDIILHCLQFSIRTYKNYFYFFTSFLLLEIILPAVSRVMPVAILKAIATGPFMLNAT